MLRQMTSRSALRCSTALPSTASSAVSGLLRGWYGDGAGRSDVWLKVKSPAAPAVRREAEEE